jgi:xanthine dehydrogenase accessory factor
MRRSGLHLSEREIIRQLNIELEKGNPTVLCTLYYKDGSGPREPGAKMLITSKGKTIGTIGGGGMERLLVKKAFTVMKKGKPQSFHFAMGIPARKGMIAVESKCGGEVKIFMDLIKPEPKLIILGSGLIAQAVARYSNRCGFGLIVVDDAPTANAKNFPNAIIFNTSFPKSLEKLKIKSNDYIAVLHGDTNFELEGLRYAVRVKPAYIGLLGSKNKRKEHVKKLIEEGFENAETIKGPIGLKIGAETPEEIGISIVAELIKHKRC